MILYIQHKIWGQTVAEIHGDENITTKLSFDGYYKTSAGQKS